ncbi:hypothetical protein GQ42DRAFT_159897 [Ramicandelaber brevisporus]|nr:hypothetical protein GQ42DRAFT_159897 [Ramicandelaber brevisporus]
MPPKSSKPAHTGKTVVEAPFMLTDFPRDILSFIAPEEGRTLAEMQTNFAATEGDRSNTAVPAKAASKFTCMLCNAVFETSLQQRSHFQSQWHVINLQLRDRTRGLGVFVPVTEEQFNKLTEAFQQKDNAVGDAMRARVDRDLLALGVRSTRIDDSDIESLDSFDEDEDPRPASAKRPNPTPAAGKGAAAAAAAAEHSDDDDDDDECEFMSADEADRLSGDDYDVDDDMTARHADGDHGDILEQLVAMRMVAAKRGVLDRIADEQASDAQHLGDHFSWFRPSFATDDTVQLYGIYRELLVTRRSIRKINPLDPNAPSLPMLMLRGLHEIRRLTIAPQSKKPALWTIMLIGSGYFAGAIYNLYTHEMVAHKTLKRYTVRKKQGKAQYSVGAAGSAGSRLRMEQDKRLREDIEKLMVAWKGYIADSSHIFLRVSEHYRQTVLRFPSDRRGSPAAEDARSHLINSDDPRIRSIPFTVKKGSLDEVRRVYKELQTVRLRYLDGSKILKQDVHNLKKVAQAELQEQHELQQQSAAAIPTTLTAEATTAATTTTTLVEGTSPLETAQPKTITVQPEVKEEPVEDPEAIAARLAAKREKERERKRRARQRKSAERQAQLHKNQGAEETEDSDEDDDDSDGSDSSESDSQYSMTSRANRMSIAQIEDLLTKKLAKKGDASAARLRAIIQERRDQETREKRVAAMNKRKEDQQRGLLLAAAAAAPTAEARAQLFEAAETPTRAAAPSGPTDVVRRAVLPETMKREASSFAFKADAPRSRFAPAPIAVPAANAAPSNPVSPTSPTANAAPNSSAQSTPELKCAACGNAITKLVVKRNLNFCSAKCTLARVLNKS